MSWRLMVLAYGLCLAVTAACDVKVGDDGVSVDFATGKASDQWRRTYDLPPGGRLEIVNVNGEIAASPSGGARVEVEATRDVRAGNDETARRLLGTVVMREEVTSDRVSIEARADWGGGGGFGVRQLSVQYSVRVPSGLDLVLRTQNGDVRVENVEGRIITASTTNGSVTGSGLSGSVEATTVNGGIQIDLEALTGDARIVTVNGGVRLVVAPDIGAELDAGVVNGTVVVDDSIQLAAQERTRQRVTGRINAGGPRIVVQTTNGAVRVTARGVPGA